MTDSKVVNRIVNSPISPVSIVKGMRSNISQRVGLDLPMKSVSMSDANKLALRERFEYARIPPDEVIGAGDIVLWESSHSYIIIMYGIQQKKSRQFIVYCNIDVLDEELGVMEWGRFTRTPPQTTAAIMDGNWTSGTPHRLIKHLPPNTRTLNYSRRGFLNA